MLYTGKGDDGTTKFLCPDGKRQPKSSPLAEALGAVDELNSLLGLCKVQSAHANLTFMAEREGEKQEFTVRNVVDTVQQDLFIVQAELAGADKKIESDKVRHLEFVVNSIETQLPPITSFIVPGGTELSAWFDLARTVARQAERRVVGAGSAEKAAVSPETLAYLNRLSSVLYALARLASTKAGVEEDKPHY